MLVNKCIKKHTYTHTTHTHTHTHNTNTHTHTPQPHTYTHTTHTYTHIPHTHKIIDDPTCVCRKGPQTVQHIIFDCPLLQKEREN